MKNNISKNIGVLTDKFLMKNIEVPEVQYVREDNKV